VNDPVPSGSALLTRRQCPKQPAHEMHTLKFRTTEESIDESTQLVAVHGDVDLKTARPFREALDDAASDAKERLIVDLSEVAFMDSSGLAALIGAKKSIPATTRMVVISPPALKRIFEVTRMDAMVTVVDSLPAALVA
jgi:anti-anti-sigma factor